MNGGLSMVEMKRKYKKSEYGLIPVDWKEGTFADFLEGFSAGATPYRGITSNFKGKIKWISSGELNYNRINDTIEHISEEAFTKTSLKIHPEGTFLMAITGLEAAGTRGRCAFVGNPAATNQSCMAIYPTDKMINEYLYYFYRKYSEILANKYCQGTKQKSYTSNIVKLLPIVCPPSIKEQASIAAALSDVDSLISALTKKIEKKKAIKLGLMQQLLTGKKRLPGFNDKWKSMLLGDIAEVKDGTHQTPKYVKSGGKPFYSVENVTADDFKNVKHISLEEHKALTSNYRIEKGDVLMTRIGSIGCCKYVDWDVDASFYVSLALLKINEKYDSKFISYLSNIKSFKEEVMLNSLVFAIPQKINLGNISLIKVYIPTSKAEQTAISNILSDCDSEIAALEEKRDKYKEIKQGMMQQLLTGKIRLIK